MRRLISTTVAVALSAACLMLPAASSADEPLLAPAGVCPGSDRAPASTAEAGQAMLCEVNWARVNYGLRALRPSPVLDTSALGKVADILACDEFSHTACGRNWLAPIRDAGYLRGCWQAGENLGWGQGELGTPESIMAAWLGSPPHRANILDPDYVDLGVGSGTGTLEGNEEAVVWVTHFGSHCEGLKDPAAQDGSAGTVKSTPPRRFWGTRHRGLSSAEVARAGSKRGRHRR